MALVMSAERGEPLVPQYFETPTAFEAAFPTTGPKLSGLIWGASRDGKISGSPTRVVTVRVDPAVKADAFLVDTDDANVFKVEAADYGIYGNQLWSKVESASTSGLKYTFGIGQTEEVFDNVELDAFSVTREADATTEAEISVMTLTVTPSTGVVVRCETPAHTVFSLTAGAHFTKWAFNGDLTIVLDQVTNDGACEVVVVGDNEDGTAQTVTTAIGASTTSVTTGKTWTKITSITVNDDGNATTVTVKADSFNLPIAQFPTISDVVGRINGDPTLGYEAKLLTGQTIDVVDLDKVTTADCTAAGGGKASADVLAADTKINSQSELITVTRQTGAVTLPETTGSAKVYLTSGSDGVADDGDWKSALQALETEYINVVVPLTTSASIHELVRVHCNLMSGEGGDERNAYIGAAANEDLGALHDRVIVLNNRNMSLTAQEIQVFTPAGEKTWRSPEYTALLMGSLQCSRPLGIPLTWKLVNVLDFRQKTNWNPHDNGEEALEKGLTLIEDSRLGPRILRQLTTYQQSAHEVYCEISRNESANESVKNVRRAQERFIGDPDVPGTRGTVQAVARQELERQVRDGEIKAYGNLQTTEIALGFQTVYDLVPVGAITFINTIAYLQKEIAA